MGRGGLDAVMSVEVHGRQRFGGLLSRLAEPRECRVAAASRPGMLRRLRAPAAEAEAAAVAAAAAAEVAAQVEEDEADVTEGDASPASEYQRTRGVPRSSGLGGDAVISNRIVHQLGRKRFVRNSSADDASVASTARTTASGSTTSQSGTRGMASSIASMDRHAVVLRPDADYVMIAVFAGHGPHGAEIAEMAANVISDVLEKRLLTSKNTRHVAHPRRGTFSKEGDRARSRHGGLPEKELRGVTGLADSASSVSADDDAVSSESQSQPDSMGSTLGTQPVMLDTPRPSLRIDTIDADAKQVFESDLSVEPLSHESVSALPSSPLTMASMGETPPPSPPVGSVGGRLGSAQGLTHERMHVEGKNDYTPRTSARQNTRLESLSSRKGLSSAPADLENVYNVVPVELAMQDAFVEASIAIDALPIARHSGTTASVVVVRGGRLVVGSVGDSTLLLGRRRSGVVQLQRLSTPHAPTLNEELERVLRFGGVVQGGGLFVADHLERRSLAVTRSLGDTEMRRVGVCQLPHIASMPVTHRDAVFALSTVPLWENMDVVAPERLSDVLNARLDGPMEISHALLDVAFGPSGPATDATLVCMQLRR